MEMEAEAVVLPPAFNHPTPLEFALAFGARLKKARLAVGYKSQTALARRMCLHPMTVHKHEMQGFLPNRTTIDQYAWMLGVTPQWLLYGVDDPLIDLPEAVRDYLLGRHGETLSHETRKRLIAVQWGVLCGDYVDSVMVHDVRRLIDDNLRARASSSDVAPRLAPPEQLPLRHVALPTEPTRTRRITQHPRQAALSRR